MLPSDIRSLTEAYQSIYTPKEDVVDLSEGFLTEELFDLTDEEIQEQVEEFFLECVEEGYDIDDVERLIYEHIDSSLEILSERVDPKETQRRRDQAKDRLSTGAAMKKAASSGSSSGGEKSSKLSRLKSAVGKAASAAKAGAKAAGKAATGGVGLAARAVGTAQRAGSAVKSAAKSGYERGKQGSEGGSSSSSGGASSSSGSSSGGGSSSSSGGGRSSSSDDGGSSAAPRKRKDGLLKRALKKVVRGAAKVVSTGAGAVKAGADYVADRARKEELEATGLFSDKEIEAIMENIMKGPLLPGEGRPTYPAGQAPKPTGAKLPLAKKQTGATTQMAGYEPEGEMVDEARRADKEGYARGTKENPERKDIPHGDPSQRTMLHSRLKRRANEMGRERRSSARNKAGGRTPVSKKEKAFLRAADRTASQVRNPNVPKTGEHKKKIDENLILDYLMNEGFAKTEDSAKVIMSNMSEAWIKSILEQAPPPPFLPNSNDSPEVQAQKRKEHNKKHSNYTGAGLGNRPVDGTGTGP